MNRNLQGIEISGIRKIFNKLQEVPDAISLTLGQPDFKVPDRIKRAMVDAINNDNTIYTANAGIYELRKEICSYLEGYNINYEPEEVCITVGGSEGLYSVLSALINPGDRLIIPDPAYPAYKSIGTILGAEIDEYKLQEDFSLNFEDLKLKIKKGSNNILVLSFPSNPTGAILSLEDRKKLQELIKENEILVITDEIYSALCYSEYYSVAECQDIKEKIIYVSGFSKMFSMTGLRVGYVCAPKEILREIMKVHQYNVSCATSISQYAALEGLRSSMGDVNYMKETFRERRDFVYYKLLKLGFQCNLPQGAFYIFPSIKGFNIKSEDFCDDLLYKGKVACVPGTAFGARGEGFIRISYSYSKEELQEALFRIEKWIDKK
ncbi:pyridoxal phosphate-dependent aminotransferase [Alloiococcus sp. CFN-8]|uniref:pyridoxal phosphate-dependent aminotransferase n=1 Tax=Alloiococcus sp. CFN-8 TaxID=3416081 RepID=UPI003CEA4AE2